MCRWTKAVRVGWHQLKFTMCGLANIYQSHYMHMGWYLLSTLRVCQPTAPNIFYTTNSMWAHIYYLSWVSISFTWFYSTLLSLTWYYLVLLDITRFYLVLLGMTWYYLTLLSITRFMMLVRLWHWSAHGFCWLMMLVGKWHGLAYYVGPLITFISLLQWLAQQIGRGSCEWTHHGCKNIRRNHFSQCTGRAVT